MCALKMYRLERRIHRVEKCSSSPEGSYTRRFTKILVIASLPLVLLSFCIITPSALANETTDTEGFITSAENPSAIAAPDQDSGSATAETIPSEFSLSQPSQGAPSADSSVSGTAGDKSSAVNEITTGSVSQDSLSQQANGAFETKSQSPSTSTAALSNENTAVSSAATTASHEDDGDEKHDYELLLTCSAGDRGTYWASREDYDDRLLSIDYSLLNTGTGTAYNVLINEATASTGVSVATTLPVMLGDLDPGELVYFTLKWLLPSRVGSFTTEITACADDKGDDEDGEDEDLNGDKPPGDGGQLNYPRDNAADGSTDARTSQNNLSQYRIVHSALPSTGFEGLNAGLLIIALLACGTLLALPVTANGKRRRR